PWQRLASPGDFHHRLHRPHRKSEPAAEMAGGQLEGTSEQRRILTQPSQSTGRLRGDETRYFLVTESRHEHSLTVLHCRLESVGSHWLQRLWAEHATDQERR